MRPRKIFLLFLLALLALAAMAATSSAHRGLGLEGQTRIRATDSTMIFTAGERIITCEVTLEGTTVALTAKTRGASIGSVTRGSVNERACRDNVGELELQGELGARSLLPWTITYDSITGTLPNIATVLILILILIKINIFVGGALVANCSYSSTVEILIRAPRWLSLIINFFGSIFRSEGMFGFLCPREATIEAETVFASLLTFILLT